MLKRVVRQSPDGRPAFLFTGFLRGEHADRVIERFDAVGDVFVVTNDDESVMLQEVRRRFRNVYTVEDNKDWAKAQKTFFGMEYGRGLLQWQKFEIGLQLIRDAEKQQGQAYTTVYKLRTDVNYLKNVYVADTFHASNPGSVFMDSDKIFGGHRDTITALDGFVEHALENYCGKQDRYWPMNMDLLIASDFTAAKFHWLKFPRALAPFLGRRLSELAFRQHLLENINYVDLSAPHYSDLVTFRKGSPETSWFPSEPCFAHYILHRGFIAQGFGDHFVEPGKLTLLKDRFDHDLRAAKSAGLQHLAQALKHKGFRRAYKKRGRR